MENEIWKDIVGYEDYYQCSNLGRVKSLDRIVIRVDNVKINLKSKFRKGTFNTNKKINVVNFQELERENFYLGSNKCC